MKRGADWCGPCQGTGYVPRAAPRGQVQKRRCKACGGSGKLSVALHRGETMLDRTERPTAPVGSAA